MQVAIGRPFRNLQILIKPTQKILHAAWPGAGASPTPKETLENRHFGDPVTQEHLRNQGSIDPGLGFPEPLYNYCQSLALAQSHHSLTPPLSGKMTPNQS